MEKRIIGVVGAFDRNGIYGIGPHLPWGSADGRSKLKLDMGRFVEVTRKSAPEGKQNVLVIGRGTAEAMDMRPLPGRHMVVISNTLDEKAVNATLPDGKKIAVVKNVQQAIERATAFDDCGHILFGGGYEVWLQALKSGLCTHAFITVVMCDSDVMSLYCDEVRQAPEMTNHATFVDMTVESYQVNDKWDDKDVELEFRNYMKI